MKVKIGELANYEEFRIALYGKRDDDESWYWAMGVQYEGDERLGTASEICCTSTPYTSLSVEHVFDPDENPEEYEAECEAIESIEAEEYEIILPPPEEEYEE